MFVQFWVQIHTQRQKLHPLMGSNPFFVIFDISHYFALFRTIPHYFGTEKMAFWYFDKQKEWRERPFGHITFLSELKMASFRYLLSVFGKKRF